jgi:hypothetical protein
MASDFNKHAVVNLDKVHAAYNGNLESVVHTADLDNGSVIFLGEQATGEREVINVKVPATATITTDAVVLVHSPEITYLAGMDMRNFYNKAGEFARAYHLEEGDIFTLDATMITGAPAVGSFVAPADSATKLVASVALPTTRFIGEITEATTVGAYRAPAFTIRVRKN